MLPTTEELIDAVASDIDVVTAIASEALDRPVPSCPEWFGRDVLAHLGRVFTSVSRTVDTRAQQMIPRGEMPEPPPSDQLVAWIGETGGALVASLRGIDPDEPVWSWSTDCRGRFYHRRMAHEVAIHRHDLEAAIGSPIDSRSAVSPRVAADGVDEYFDLVLPFSVARWPRPIPTLPLHVVAVDMPDQAGSAGRWTVRRDDEGIALERSILDGPGVGVSGPVGELRLWVWNRPSAVVVSGDEQGAAAWAALAP